MYLKYPHYLKSPTSKAATTSRAPLAEAEESMDSDDNDDRLSSQEQEKNTPQNVKSAKYGKE
jgi:hypothetical protein